VKLERPVAEFWTLNPAQTIFVLEAGGQIQRTRGARDFMAHLGGMGVPIDRG
jgi:hypothetical protein